MRMYYNILKSMISHKLNIVTHPFLCTFLITFKCNCKCYMCDIWKKEKSKEMSKDEIKYLFSQLKFLDVVRITGGEPFMRDDLIEIVRDIQNVVNPKIIHLTTNGIFTDKIVEFIKLVDSRGIHFKISLDGVGEKHNQVRGVKDAYEKVYTTLIELLKLRKRHKFYLRVDQTITDKNIGEIEKLTRFSRQLGVDIYYDFALRGLCLYQPTFTNKPDNCEPSLLSHFTREQLELILRAIEKNSYSHNVLERLVDQYYYLGIKNRLLFNKREPVLNCMALYTHLRILPDGRVPICIYDPTIVGDLLKEPFEQIWYDPGLEEYRKRVKSCGGCWISCEVKASSVYSGDILRSLFSPQILRKYLKA